MLGGGGVSVLGGGLGLDGVGVWLWMEFWEEAEGENTPDGMKAGAAHLSSAELGGRESGLVGCGGGS